MTDSDEDDYTFLLSLEAIVTISLVVLLMIVIQKRVELFRQTQIRLHPPRALSPFWCVWWSFLWSWP